MRVSQLIGKFTMYRMVTIVLAALAGYACIVVAARWHLPEIFSLWAMVITFLVLCGASLGTSLVIGWIIGAKPHIESAVISALILWFLYWPTSQFASLTWLAFIAAVTQASKYLLAFRQRHIFNPVAVGIIVSKLVSHVGHIDAMPQPGWWIAAEIFFWPTLIGAVIVLSRTQRLSVAAVFAAIFLPASVLLTLSLMPGAPLSSTIETVVYSFPWLFFAGFMLTEPLTLPPRKRQQWALAALAAVIVVWPMLSQELFGRALTVAPFESTWELSLIATGLVSLWFRRHVPSSMILQERRELGSGLVSYRWATERPMVFEPGQFIEIDVPHAEADLRGRRRAFSVSSTPQSEIEFITKEPFPGSTFKTALARAVPGKNVRVTGLWGDFVLPAKGPLLLIAGGVGITPFLSQIRSSPGRDVIIVHAVSDASEALWAEELTDLGAEVIVIEKEIVTAADVLSQVPDAASRRALISGPPAMVRAMSAGLAGRVKSVRTDVFFGY